MKNTLSLVAILSISWIGFTSAKPIIKRTPLTALEGTISMSGAFALYPMAVVWASEFKKIHPKVRLDISAGGAGKGISDVLSKLVDIGLVSRDVYPEEIKKGGFPIAVTKDAVILTLNEKNPNLSELLKKGIQRDALVNIFATGKYTNWKQLGLQKGAPLHVYTRSDASGAGETWGKFLGVKQEDLMGVGVYGDPGVAQAVKKDPIGIGYNNIAYIYDPKSRKPSAGITVVPLDLNKNGRVDADENFYDTLDALSTAIARGKYPMPPARNLYFLTSGKPMSKLVQAFIQWVLTDGQKFVVESGYIQLAPEKLKEGLKNLN
jgi:phosphate transport system substrate-binding protein